MARHVVFLQNEFKTKNFKLIAILTVKIKGHANEK